MRKQLKQTCILCAANLQAYIADKQTGKYNAILKWLTFGHHHYQYQIFHNEVHIHSKRETKMYKDEKSTYIFAFIHTISRTFVFSFWKTNGNKVFLVWTESLLCWLRFYKQVVGYILFIIEQKIFLSPSIQVNTLNFQSQH